MIILEKFDPSGYNKLIGWVNSEESLMQFAGPAFTFPLTEDQLEESLSNKNRIAFKVIDEISKEAIGHAEIFLGEKSAWLGKILIGDKNLRGNGIGQKIVQRLLEYVFTDLQQSKAELNVFDWNVPAIKCYEKCGFVINPDKRFERKINGQTWIALNMIATKEEWQNNRCEKTE